MIRTKNKFKFSMMRKRDLYRSVMQKIAENM